MARRRSSSLSQKALVVSGRSGNMIHPKMPTGIVTMPRMMYSHFQPGRPWRPSMVWCSAVIMMPENMVPAMPLRLVTEAIMGGGANSLMPRIGQYACQSRLACTTTR